MAVARYSQRRGGCARGNPVAFSTLAPPRWRRVERKRVSGRTARAIQTGMGTRMTSTKQVVGIGEERVE